MKRTRATAWWSLVAAGLDLPLGLAAWWGYEDVRWLGWCFLVPAAVAGLSAYGCWRGGSAGRDAAKAAVIWHAIAIVLLALPSWLLSLSWTPSLLILSLVLAAERRHESASAAPPAPS